MNKNTITQYINNKQWVFWILFLITLAFNLWLAGQIPYTHDDWDWGISLGIEHFLTADINSRYAGNLLEIILTRSVFLKTVVMGLTFTMIPYVISRLIEAITELKRTNKLFVLIRSGVFIFSTIMFWAIPTDVWCQTNGWVAGFSNFVFSALLLLLFFYIVVLHCRSNTDSYEYKSGKGRKVAKILLIFLFCAVIQLFLENLAIFIWLFGVCFLIFSLAKNKSNRGVAVAILVGATVGLAIMFSSNIYQSLWNTGTAYYEVRILMWDRSQPITTFIHSAGARYLKRFFHYIVGNHAFLCFAISGLLFLSGLRQLLTKKLRSAKKIMHIVLCIGNVVFGLYYVYSFLRGSFPFSRWGVLSLIDIFFLLLIAIELFVFYKEKKRLCAWMFVILVSPFALMVPMVMINAVGPRSYYTPIICFILLGSLILADFMIETKHFVRIAILLACLAVFVACGIRLAKIYHPIGQASRERYELIQKAQAGEIKEITFSYYPNSQFLWKSLPKQQHRIEYFREFYKIPSDVEIVFEKKKKNK